MLKKAMITVALAMTLVCMLSIGARADEASPAALQAKNEADFKAASDAANKAAIAGPKDVPLAGQATLHLPQGYFFVPQPEAGQFSRALGNNPPNLVGLVGSSGGGDWLAYVDYHNDGHVADDDAKTWNPDDMLASLKEGTEAANADRKARGFPELEVSRWIEPPVYDANVHHLVWSAMVLEKDNPAASGTANYNTYALGRDGHFALDLVANADQINGFKANAKDILGALEFNPGHRYSDYNASTDRLAAYGLAALVGGVAAKKLGLIALAGALIAKFAKLIGLAVLAVFASIRRFFRQKKPADQTQEDQAS